MSDPVHFTLDNRPVDLADWQASTVANGGFDNFTASASESSFRRFPSAFDQGAPLRAFLDDGTIIWEGELSASPFLRRGTVALTAEGPFNWAEQETGTLLFQSRDASQGIDEASPPFSQDTTGPVQVSVEPGAWHYRVNAGTTSSIGVEHGIALWLQGVKIRRFRCTVYVSGASSNFNFRVYKATGPQGTRTEVGSFSATSGTLVDISISSPEDMIVVVMRGVASANQTADADVYLRDWRVNDLTTADDFSCSAVASVVGSRLGWDTTGIPSGPGVDTANPAIVTERILTRRQYNPDLGAWENFGLGGGVLLSSEYTPAVQTSALNALPLTWGGTYGGTWADLLDHLSELLDWRWTVGADLTGNGPHLNFAPWGPVHEVMLERDGSEDLVPQPRVNVVEVYYNRENQGLQKEVRRLDPDPLSFRNRRDRKHVVTLSEIYPDNKVARQVADILIKSFESPRFTGSLDIVQASSGSPYKVRAGSMVVVGDYEPGRSMPMRVSETLMSPQGVRLGIGAPSGISSFLGLFAKRQLRKPYGTVTRYEYFTKKEANKAGLL